MKVTNRGPDRFSDPTVLREDAPFLGATVKVWDDLLTGNMEKSLAKVKHLAEGSVDLASAVGKRQTGEK